LSFDRKAGEEWLDQDRGTPSEVASALRSLNFVNRWFGGDRTHRYLLGEVSIGRTQLSVLEAAAGRATALAYASLSLAQRRPQPVTVHATLLDRQSSHFPPEWPPSLPAPTLLHSDALVIPLPAKSVDIVSCCLFLHHLSPEQAAIFLREAVRVARIAVLINDLERTRFHYLLARLFSLLDPSRLSRHDGPVSVRQAYSAAELRSMLSTAAGRVTGHGSGEGKPAGHRITVRRVFLYRLAALLWVSQP
jgi:hypothetical protein